MSAPVRILSLGAGVQSTTVALLAVHGEIEPIERAIFADTGNEPREVYEHLARLTAQLEAAGLPVDIVRNTRGTRTGNLADDFIARWSGEIDDHCEATPPLFTRMGDAVGPLRRQCTLDYKIKPINWRLRDLYGITSRTRGVVIDRVMGISLDEIQRMRDSKERWARNVYPLVDLRMTRHDCLQWMQSHGYPEPARSACVFCPYHSDAEWRRLRDEDPDSWDEAVRFDHDLRATASPNRRRIPVKGDLYVHRAAVPLDEVDLSTAEDRGQLNLFAEECEGMCGV